MLAPTTSLPKRMMTTGLPRKTDIHTNKTHLASLARTCADHVRRKTNNCVIMVNYGPPMPFALGPRLRVRVCAACIKHIYTHAMYRRAYIIRVALRCNFLSKRCLRACYALGALALARSYISCPYGTLPFHWHVSRNHIYTHTESGRYCICSTIYMRHVCCGTCARGERYLFHCEHTQHTQTQTYSTQSPMHRSTAQQQMA